MAGQQARRRLADLADAERIDEAVERDRAPRLDGRHQVGDRLLAPALALLQRRAWRASAGRCRPASGSARPARRLGMCLSPSPSMSKASRLTKCRSRSTAWAAQISPPVQRRTDLARLAHREAAADRAVVGKLEGLRLLRARCSSTTPTICGMTSPARWMIDRCRRCGCPCARSRPRCAAWRGCTTTPPTVIGSSSATGVSAPVRPTWIVMSRSSVSACSAGNLCAIAQRGARLTKPSRSCQSSRLTL